MPIHQVGAGLDAIGLAWVADELQEYVLVGLPLNRVQFDVFNEDDVGCAIGVTE